MSEEKFIRINKSKHIIKCEVSGKEVDIDVFFSIKCLEMLSDYYKKNNTYKESFAKVSFYMYSITDMPNFERTISLEDFLKAKEDELQKIISSILSQDESLSKEYNNLEYEDVFERFYIANENILKNVMKLIVKPLKQFNNMTFPHITTFDRIAQQQAMIMKSAQFPNLNSFYNVSLVLQKQATCITEHFKPFEINYDRISPKFDFPQLKTVLDNIHKIAFDISDVLSPAIQQIAEMQDEIRNQLQDAINTLAKPLSSIDFSLLTYHFEWSEKHDLLVKFGWFYLNELPDKIINMIYEKRDTITGEEVDFIIISYFRDNRCVNLKQVVKKWSSSRYFKSRERIFHEALVNHSRKYFNSSTTLLVLHTEGVITDFVRIGLQTPRFKSQQAVMDITACLNDMPMNMLNLSDWQVYNFVFERILEAFKEKFELSNPDGASNSSRHKIAHGHSVEEETEINSLKRFLYLNEVYRLFSKLDENLIRD